MHAHAQPARASGARLWRGFHASSAAADGELHGVRDASGGGGAARAVEDEALLLRAQDKGTVLMLCCVPLTSRVPLVIQGKEVMAHLGLKPGPHVKACV